MTASIQQMTIRNGVDQGRGGVQVTSAPLTLRKAIVENSESSLSGGGIAVGGPDAVLHVRNSIIRFNRAQSFGGRSGAGRYD